MKINILKKIKVFFLFFFLLTFILDLHDCLQLKKEKIRINSKSKNKLKNHTKNRKYKNSIKNKLWIGKCSN